MYSVQETYRNFLDMVISLQSDVINNCHLHFRSKANAALIYLIDAQSYNLINGFSKIIFIFERIYYSILPTNLI